MYTWDKVGERGREWIEVLFFNVELSIFRGKYIHAIDEKGRVNIPAKFRDVLLEGKDETSLVITLGERCLTAYPEKKWEELEQKIALLPQFDPKIVAFKRFIVGNAQECTMDRSGRILIPGDLRKDADIGKDCVVLGQLDKFEIWSLDLYEKDFREVKDQFALISSNLSQLGITI